MNHASDSTAVGRASLDVSALVARFGEVPARTAEQLTRYGYAAACDVMGFARDQLNAGVQATDLARLYVTSSGYANRLAARAIRHSGEIAVRVLESQAEFARRLTDATCQLAATPMRIMRLTSA